MRRPCPCAACLQLHASLYVRICDDIPTPFISAGQAPKESITRRPMNRRTPSIASPPRLAPHTATLPADRTTLVYGARHQDCAERLDLTPGGESYAESNQRVFGCLASQAADADGHSNYEQNRLRVSHRSLLGSDSKRRLNLLQGSACNRTNDRRRPRRPGTRCRRSTDSS